MSRRKKRSYKKAQKVIEPQASEEIRIAGRVTIGMIAGVVLIFLFANGVAALFTNSVVTATESNYEDRELEILSYRWGPHENAEDARTIRGIIHPEGIEVVTTDNTVSLVGLNDSNALFRSAPSEEEVIGKRIIVKYFVGNVDDLRWWHPPVIHNRTQFYSNDRFYIWLFTIAYLIMMTACFTYAYRWNRKYLDLTKNRNEDD